MQLAILGFFFNKHTSLGNEDFCRHASISSRFFSSDIFRYAIFVLSSFFFQEHFWSCVLTFVIFYNIGLDVLTRGQWPGPSDPCAALWGPPLAFICIFYSFSSTSAALPTQKSGKTSIGLTLTTDRRDSTRKRKQIKICRLHKKSSKNGRYWPFKFQYRSSLKNK